MQLSPENTPDSMMTTDSKTVSLDITDDKKTSHLRPRARRTINELIREASQLCSAIDIGARSLQELSIKLGIILSEAKYPMSIANDDVLTTEEWLTASRVSSPNGAPMNIPVRAPD